MSSPSDLFLVVDMQNRRLVGLNGSPSELPDIYQDNNLPLRIQCVNPGISTLPTGSSISTPYVIQDMTGFGMQVAVGATPQGEGGPPPMAEQTNMVWDGVKQWFAGKMAMNTSGVDDFLGTSASKTAYFEIDLIPAGDQITILQASFNLRAIINKLTGTTPVPTNQYLTAVQTNAGFVPRKMENGGTILIPSENGAYAVELGCNDDGTVKMNIVTL